LSHTDLAAQIAAENTADIAAIAAVKAQQAAAAAAQIQQQQAIQIASTQVPPDLYAVPSQTKPGEFLLTNSVGEPVQLDTEGHVLRDTVTGRLVTESQFEAVQQQEQQLQQQQLLQQASLTDRSQHSTTSSIAMNSNVAIASGLRSSPSHLMQTAATNHNLMPRASSPARDAGIAINSSSNRQDSLSSASSRRSGRFVVTEDVIEEIDERLIDQQQMQQQQQQQQLQQPLQQYTQPPLQQQSLQYNAEFVPLSHTINTVPELSVAVLPPTHEAISLLHQQQQAQQQQQALFDQQQHAQYLAAAQQQGAPFAALTDASLTTQWGALQFLQAASTHVTALIKEVEWLKAENFRLFKDNQALRRQSHDATVNAATAMHQVNQQQFHIMQQQQQQQRHQQVSNAILQPSLLPVSQQSSAVSSQRSSFGVNQLHNPIIQQHQQHSPAPAAAAATAATVTVASPQRTHLLQRTLSLQH
jgi:hypothetical protein